MRLFKAAVFQELQFIRGKNIPDVSVTENTFEQ